MSVHASTTSPPNTPSPPTPSCGNFWHYRCRLQNWELSLPPYPLAKMCHCPAMSALRLLAGWYHFLRGKLGRLTALVGSIIVCIKRMRGYNSIKEREQGSNIGRNHLFLEIFTFAVSNQSREKFWSIQMIGWTQTFLCNFCENDQQKCTDLVTQKQRFADANVQTIICSLEAAAKPAQIHSLQHWGYRSFHQYIQKFTYIAPSSLLFHYSFFNDTTVLCRLSVISSRPVLMVDLQTLLNTSLRSFWMLSIFVFRNFCKAEGRKAYFLSSGGAETVCQTKRCA